jgi:hypothetical protein
MHAVLFVGLALAGKRSIQTLAILGLLRGMFSNGLPEVDQAQLCRLTHPFASKPAPTDRGSSGWHCIEASTAGVGARLLANAVLPIH